MIVSLLLFKHTVSDDRPFVSELMVVDLAGGSNLLLYYPQE